MWRDYFDDDLSEVAFTNKVMEFLGIADLDWIVEARHKEGIRPVGLVLAYAMLDGRRIEPHIDWFPWATPRNKLEGMAAYLRDVSKQYKILVYVKTDETLMWERLTKYRILCRACKIRDHYSRGEHAMHYYTAGP